MWFCWKSLIAVGCFVARYRGRLDQDNGRLKALCTIITCIVQQQVIDSPLRLHEELLDEAELDLVDEAAEALVHLLPGREVINGMEIGTAADIRAMPDGTVRGPKADDEDNEPDSAMIDTLRTVDDFRAGLIIPHCSLQSITIFANAGDEVLVWWWGIWWRALVRYVAHRKQTLTVQWMWSKKTTSNYLPRLVQKEDD